MARHDVRWNGRRDAEERLSWGQTAIWNCIQWRGEDDAYFCVPRVVAVPEGLTTDGVAAALSAVMAECESLRTMVTGGDAGALQHVHGSGSLELETIEWDPARGEDHAGDVAAELAGRGFRLAREWPIRFAVIGAGGSPRWLAYAVSHQAVDFWGLQQLETLVRDALARPDELEGREDGRSEWQPLEQATWERSGEGLARSRASLTHWRETLSRVPASMFDLPPVANDSGRPFVKVRLESRALAAATHLVADATGVSTGTVLLCASLAVLGAYTGHPQVAAQLISINRHDDVRRRMVGPMVADALLGLNLDRVADFAAFVKASYLPVMAAYRAGHYDPDDLAVVKAEVSRERGVRFDLSTYWNDVRLSDRWEEAPDATGDVLVDLLRESTLEIVGDWERQDSTYFISTGYLPDRAVLNVLADTRLVPLRDVESLLLATERLVVAAGQGAVRMVDVPAVAGVPLRERPPNYCAVGPDWVDVEALGALLRELSGARAVHVAVHGDRLHAHLLDATGVGPADLHDALLAALDGRRALVAPAVYLTHSAATDRGPLPLQDWWDRLPVLTRTAGIARPVPAPA